MKNIESLFQQAKEIPPEIPLKKMEKMILSFPDHPVPITETHWFVKLFNLKYIAMTIIPIIAALTFLWAPVQQESNSPVTQVNHNTLSLKQSNTPEDLIPIQTEKKLPSPIQTTTPTLPKSIVKTTIIVDLPSTDSLIPDNLSIVTKATIPEKSIKLDREIEPEYRVYPLFPELIELEEVSTPLPDINSPQLKKLRRTLYKSLKKDGILTNKNTLVEMELRSDMILVNNQPLPEKFLIKYQTLTNIVGIGPERKIKMNSDFILAGDFTKDGFKGHGHGRFMVKMAGLDTALLPLNNFKGQRIPDGTDLFQPNSFWEKREKEEEFLERERKALNAFAREIQQQTPGTSGRKRLTSPNLKGKKGEDLHAAITLLLTDDNYLNEEEEFAVIQLPKDIIRINGQELNGDQLKKYHQLIDKYGIKHGRDRMILLSPHFLKAGNYNYGNFTGTIITLPLRE